MFSGAPVEKPGVGIGVAVAFGVDAVGVAEV